MLRIKEVIVVEGRYDKNTLSQLVDTTIIETGGFGIFSDRDKLELIKKLASKRGIIILTDGDGAGFLIRNYLKSSIAKDNIKHAYIPDIPGKERRKRSPSGEGKLGVEGMTPEILIQALRRAGATFDDGPEDEDKPPITKADLYELGLLGKEGSRERRLALIANLGLPERLSTQSLLDVLNALYDREELLNLLSHNPQ
jgi:ribonuclease M5